MAKTSKQFIASLPKIYGIYTGGFLVFILLMGFLETRGISGRNIGLMFVGFTILIYALIGWLSRTTEVDEYYLAGKKVPTVFNGMATAADWMSGASFVAMAGGIYFGGYTYMAFLIGWTGGYVLVSTLLAPYLRKFGCYTVPDFIGARYGGNFARFCAVLILLVASFTYVTAQITATGSIAQKALSTPEFPVSFAFGCYTGLITILICSMLGGMRSVTWSQVAQYIVLIIAYLIPLFWISWKYNFGIFPHVMLGDEVQRLAALEQQYGLVRHTKEVLTEAKIPNDALGNATSLKYIVGGHSAVPAGPEVAWRYISLAICMMVGTASLPHILMRYFTTPTVTAARRSVGWSLFFIGLLYLSAPMLATVSKIALMDPNLPTAIIGKKISDVMQIQWVQNWVAVKQVVIVDFNKDGILQLSEWFMNEDVVVLATPEIAGLPYVISGLVAAGGLAAAMSTADGLILAMANAISHDVYYKMIDPKATVRNRLIVARVLLIILGFAAAWITTKGLTGILGAVAWAFDFAMSGLFFPLVLGVWWKRATRSGAIAGMLCGLIAGTAYLVWVGVPNKDITFFMGATPWKDIHWIFVDNLRFGIPGALVSLITMVSVSLVTKPESKAVMDMVDEVRIASGKTVIRNA